MIDFDKVKQAIINNPNIVAEFLPSGVKNGAEYRCANIFGDKGDSFSINLNTGLWADFATGESGSSLIDLVCKQRSIPYKDAAELIARKLGIAYDTTTVVEAIKDKHLPKKDDILIPRKLPFFYPTHVYVKDKGEVKIDDLWAYKNENGAVIAFDARVNYVDEEGKDKKDIYPLRWNGKNWYTKSMPHLRPLFNLDKIKADEEAKKTIIVVEGCKTALATEHYFPNYIVTTWQGGCKAVKLADWSSIYGRNVIIIPDADKQKDDRTGDYFEWEEQPGMKAANQIASILADHRTVIRIVNTHAMSEIKSGWDIADALAGGMKQSEVIEFVRNNIYEYVQPVSKEEENIVEPEVIVRAKDKKVEYDDTYFICLGVEGNHHYFYNKTTGQIVGFSPSGYKRENLISLAPLAWWEANFPQKKGVDWESAVDWLCRVQEKSGVYDKKRIRGRGAWFDNGKPILHLGTSLFVDGNVMRIDEFNTNYIYEKAPSLAVKLQTVLPREDSSKLIDVCRLARWEKPYYGDILAGWMFSAMVCGAMPFRSHLYLIGAAGTGKSWMLDNVIKQIMGRMALSVSSKTTEPGIREALGGDILPVIFDEAEAENKNDRARLQSIFDLARQASSEGADAIYKGGSNGGGGFSYLCRSSFLFASINNSMSKDADMSRTTVIKLKNSPIRGKLEDKRKDNEAFKALESAVSKTFTEEYCRCLLTRAIQMIPTMRQCCKVISNICATEFGSKRIGDQMGMILSGIWCLKNDKVIDEESARQLINFCAIRKEKESSGDDMTQEERALNHLWYTEVMYNKEKYPLSQLIAFLMGKENIAAISEGNLAVYLANRGVRVENNDLYLSRNEKSLAAQTFKDTDWDGQGWKDALLRIPDIENVKAKRFCSSLVSAAIVIPTNVLFKAPV